MIRSVVVVFAVLLLSVSIIGCKHHDKTPKPSKELRSQQDKADTDKAAHDVQDKFETSNDPPINADTHFAAGQLAESQGDLNRAIDQYNKALKLDPGRKDALFRLGELYTNAKQFDQAIATWQQYLKATDNSAPAYSNLALCYEQAGRIDEAELAFKAGIVREPQNAACRVNYGLMLARHDRLDEAITQLGTVLTPGEVHYNLGSVFEQEGKKDQAKAYYQKALELDPNLMDARSRLANMK